MIVALGEILWDLFPSGPRFGGAPANFGYHAASLGGEVAIVSGVGDDELGHSALRNLKQSGIETGFVQIDREHPTGTVGVDVDTHGHASYSFNDDEAWDHIAWSDDLQQLASRADVACFGTLAQRSPTSRETLRRFIEATAPTTLRLLDLNLRAPFHDDDVIEHSLRLANVLKINDDELAMLATRYADGDDEAVQAKQIADRFGLDVVAVTRGSRGGLIVRGDEVSRVPSMPVDVQDTVGAGDSFTAALAMGLLRNIPLDTINRAACRIAEYVCTQAGATPPLPREVVRAW